jgi:hypothetical protein
MSTFKHLIQAAVIATVVTTAASQAHARGFIADTFVRPFSPELADWLDDLHRDLGKPLDHAIRFWPLVH